MMMSDDIGTARQQTNSNNSNPGYDTDTHLSIQDSQGGIFIPIIEPKLKVCKEEDTFSPKCMTSTPVSEYNTEYNRPDHQLCAGNRQDRLDSSNKYGPIDKIGTLGGNSSEHNPSNDLQELVTPENDPSLVYMSVETTKDYRLDYQPYTDTGQEIMDTSCISPTHIASKDQIGSNSKDIYSDDLQQQNNVKGVMDTGELEYITLVVPVLEDVSENHCLDHQLYTSNGQDYMDISCTSPDNNLSKGQRGSYEDTTTKDNTYKNFQLQIMIQDSSRLAEITTMSCAVMDDPSMVPMGSTKDYEPEDQLYIGNGLDNIDLSSTTPDSTGFEHKNGPYKGDSLKDKASKDLQQHDNVQDDIGLDEKSTMTSTPVTENNNEYYRLDHQLCRGQDNLDVLGTNPNIYVPVDKRETLEGNSSENNPSNDLQERSSVTPENDVSMVCLSEESTEDYGPDYQPYTDTGQDNMDTSCIIPRHISPKDQMDISSNLQQQNNVKRFMDVDKKNTGNLENIPPLVPISEDAPGDDGFDHQFYASNGQDKMDIACTSHENKTSKIQKGTFETTCTKDKTSKNLQQQIMIQDSRRMDEMTTMSCALKDDPSMVTVGSTEDYELYTGNVLYNMVVLNTSTSNSHAFEHNIEAFQSNSMKANASKDFQQHDNAEDDKGLKYTMTSVHVSENNKDYYGPDHQLCTENGQDNINVLDTIPNKYVPENRMKTQEDTLSEGTPSNDFQEHINFQDIIGIGGKTTILSTLEADVPMVDMSEESTKDCRPDRQTTSNSQDNMDIFGTSPNNNSENNHLIHSLNSNASKENMGTSEGVGSKDNTGNDLQQQINVQDFVGKNDETSKSDAPLIHESNKMNEDYGSDHQLYIRNVQVDISCTSNKQQGTSSCTTTQIKETDGKNLNGVVFAKEIASARLLQERDATEVTIINKTPKVTNIEDERRSKAKVRRKNHKFRSNNISINPHPEDKTSSDPGGMESHGLNSQPQTQAIKDSPKVLATKGPQDCSISDGRQFNNYVALLYGVLYAVLYAVLYTGTRINKSWKKTFPFVITYLLCSMTVQAAALMGSGETAGGNITWKQCSIHLEEENLWKQFLYIANSDNSAELCGINVTMTHTKNCSESGILAKVYNETDLVFFTKNLAPAHWMVEYGIGAQGKSLPATCTEFLNDSLVRDIIHKPNGNDNKPPSHLKDEDKSLTVEVIVGSVLAGALFGCGLVFGLLYRFCPTFKRWVQKVAPSCRGCNNINPDTNTNYDPNPNPNYAAVPLNKVNGA
ncbi:hypothetical protein GDO81_014669 [Engystomops pustulosus]|nr:hypothetical protein GDO81_014669 [Engystomops pustulosus]KAG8570053.1 hypothetical protein GDO81_014669 [Engystomops pustulosus]KAG8570054.1 hypothetical protein GDO81_014669 [Engystomops pustulosus]